MRKASSLAVIALSAIMLIIGAVGAGYVWNSENTARKPDIPYDPKSVAAYDLCDDARDMLKDSIVLYAGSSSVLINGAPGRVSANNPQAVAIIDDNEVYVPAAFIAEALGAQVNRYANAEAMAITSGHTSISFIAGLNKLSINGTQVFLPHPTFLKYGEAYIHLPSICEVFGRNVYRFGDIIMVNPIGRALELNEYVHITNDILCYFSDGKLSSNNSSFDESAVPANVFKLPEGRNIRVLLNEDELNLYTFPVTEVDPNASAHDHSLIVQSNVVMAPVVLLRLLDVNVFESVKQNAISMLEAAPFGNNTSLALKPDTDHAYLNLQGEDPYKDEESFRNRLVVLPTAPKLINNHLYIPIVEVSRLFGINANWDQKSNSLIIRSLRLSRFPNLRWAPQIIRQMKADYELVITVQLKDSEGKDLRRVDYAASGYYNSGEYIGGAVISDSSENSVSSGKETLYEAKRYLNKDFDFEYEVRNLKPRAVKTIPMSSIRYGELLMTDIEYIRQKVELMASHFYASELLKKEADVSMKGKPVDKYFIELNDMPSITELFGIARLPGIDAGKSSDFGEGEYFFEYFRMELSLDKKGQIANCSIKYRGFKKKERLSASPFEVSINADFY